MNAPMVREQLTSLAALLATARSWRSIPRFFCGRAFRAHPAGHDGRITRPLLFVTDGRRERVSHPRTSSSRAAIAQATIVESYVAVGTQCISATRLPKSPSPNAHITHLRVQRESERAFHSHTQAHQAAHSRYSRRLFATGARTPAMNIYTVLAQPGAEVTLNGLYMAGAPAPGSPDADRATSRPTARATSLQGGPRRRRANAVFNGKVLRAPRGAEDRRQADEQQPAAVPRCPRRHQAAASRSSPTMEVHARRDGRTAR